MTSHTPASSDQPDISIKPGTTDSDDRYLGIDFSGNHLMWRPRAARSNVWIAEVTFKNEWRTLRRIFPVQDLVEGHANEHPFLALANYLHSGRFKAAGIDAPFSVPYEFLTFFHSHKELCKFVAGMDRLGDRQFPRAGDFETKIRRGKMTPKKPLRTTEQYWASRKINVRATLWAGARGGAAMTAACLTLLCESDCPIWPETNTGSGLLVEAFPAAQLCHWGLPYTKYNGAEGQARNRRGEIVAGLEQHKLN
jgi:hypothetical protein